MTITYEVGNNLYVNTTNRCSNSCDFCVRQQKPSYGSGENLWLEREPTVSEITESIFSHDLSKYGELVFCGYGEPFYRIDDICEIAAEVKRRSDIKIRINTNGHGDLINKKPTAPLLVGLIDTLSISLNAPSAEKYQASCHSRFGEQAYGAMLEFAENAAKYVPNVVLSVVDIMPREDIDACRKIAESVGVTLRVRPYIDGDA